MTKDEILRMAREAQLWEGADETVIRFAALVAAQEREECAELMERQHAWITNTAAANAIRARGQIK